MFQPMREPIGWQHLHLKKIGGLLPLRQMERIWPQARFIVAQFISRLIQEMLGQQPHRQITPFGGPLLPRLTEQNWLLECLLLVIHIQPVAASSPHRPCQRRNWRWQRNRIRLPFPGRFPPPISSCGKVPTSPCGRMSPMCRCSTSPICRIKSRCQRPAAAVSTGSRRREPATIRRSVILDCGEKRSATPLFARTQCTTI